MSSEGVWIPKVSCPNCGSTLNHAANEQEEVPRPNPGDFTICLYCDHLMVFNKDLTVREATPEEHTEAETNPEVQECRIMVKMYRKIYHENKKGRSGPKN